MQQQIDPNNPVKEYTGVWIPREVMECEDLTPIDKLVYGEVACFNECYASNAWLALRIGRCERTARESIAKLKKLGFIKQVKSNGRFRIVKVAKNCHGGKKLPGRVAKNCQSEWQDIATIDKSKDKSIDNIELDKSSSMAKTPEKPTEIVEVVEPVEVVRTQRSLDIDEAFEIWREVMGYEISRSRDERFALNTLLSHRDMNLKAIRTMLLLAKEADTDRYKRFSISSFRELQRNANALMAWAREKHAQTTRNSNVIDLGAI